MDEGGIQEYIPINSQDNQLSKIDSEELSDTKTEDSLLTISDLLKKFPISRPTIYSWEKSGLLKRIPIGGRVFLTLTTYGRLSKKRKRPESLKSKFIGSHGASHVFASKNCSLRSHRTLVIHFKPNNYGKTKKRHTVIKSNTDKR